MRARSRATYDAARDAAPEWKQRRRPTGKFVTVVRTGQWDTRVAPPEERTASRGVVTAPISDPSTSRPPAVTELTARTPRLPATFARHVRIALSKGQAVHRLDALALPLRKPETRDKGSGKGGPDSAEFHVFLKAQAN
ncbi:hypothetical protein MRX96_045106 [Rhipicephalus microplus]